MNIKEKIVFWVLLLMLKTNLLLLLNVLKNPQISRLASFLDSFQYAKINSFINILECI